MWKLKFEENSPKQIWRNAALHHLQFDPLQWLGAVRMRVHIFTRESNIMDRGLVFYMEAMIWG